jgi:hypothetical protein
MLLYKYLKITVREGIENDKSQIPRICCLAGMGNDCSVS